MNASQFRARACMPGKPPALTICFKQRLTPANLCPIDANSASRSYLSDCARSAAACSRAALLPGGAEPVLCGGVACGGAGGRKK